MSPDSDEFWAKAFVCSHWIQEAPEFLVPVREGEPANLHKLLKVFFFF